MFLLNTSILLTYANILLIINVYLVFKSDNHLFTEFFSHYVFLSICFALITGGTVIYQTTHLQPSLFVVAAGILLIIFCFIDSISDTADTYFVNAWGLILICAIQPFYLYCMQFLRKHTRLIGMGVTLKQEESIKNYMTDINLLNIRLNPEYKGYKYFQIYSEYDYGKLFSNFYYFFFVRYVPESKIFLND